MAPTRSRGLRRSSRVAASTSRHGTKRPRRTAPLVIDDDSPSPPRIAPAAPTPPLQAPTRFVTAPCIPERGLVYTPGDPVATIITARSWESFCRPPVPAVVPLVREFYANGLSRTPDGILVRDVPVPFDAATINALFDLAPVPNDCYSGNYQYGNRKGPQELAAAIAQPGTVWCHQGKHLSPLPASSLTPLARLLHKFIAARLLPSSHLSNLNWRRAGLIYALQAGLPIDLGCLLHHSILQTITGKTPGHRAGDPKAAFGHCSVITALCQRAGIHPLETDERLPTPTPLALSDVGPTPSSRRTAPPSEPLPPLDVSTTLLHRLDALTGAVTAMHATLRSHSTTTHRQLRAMDRRLRDMDRRLQLLSPALSSSPSTS